MGSSKQKRKPRAAELADPKAFVETMYPHAISVTAQGDDFIAKFDDGGWAAGKSPYAAVGDLIATHGRERGIPITFDKSAETLFRRIQEKHLDRHMQAAARNRG